MPYYKALTWQIRCHRIWCGCTSAERGCTWHWVHLTELRRRQRPLEMVGTWNTNEHIEALRDEAIYNLKSVLFKDLSRIFSWLFLVRRWQWCRQYFCCNWHVFFMRKPPKVLIKLKLVLFTTGFYQSGAAANFDDRAHRQIWQCSWKSSDMSDISDG